MPEPLGLVVRPREDGPNGKATGLGSRQRIRDGN